MQHSDLIAPSARRARVFARREKGERSLAFADEHGHSIPHSFKPPFESEHLDVPRRGTLYIPDAERDVVDSLQLEHIGQIAAAISRRQESTASEFARLVI
jgi:hypothetical protein